jgi:hypothetical protein
MADIAGDKSWMKLESEGKQSSFSTKLTPKELHQKLSNPNLAWQSRFQAYISPEHGGLCVLECLTCKDVQSAANPARPLN